MAGGMMPERGEMNLVDELHAIVGALHGEAEDD
jgi:hypothetical protein